MAIIKWLSNKTSCKQDRMFKLLSESVSQSKPVGQVKEKRKKEKTKGNLSNITVKTFSIRCPCPIKLYLTVLEMHVEREFLKS